MGRRRSEHSMLFSNIIFHHSQKISRVYIYYFLHVFLHLIDLAGEYNSDKKSMPSSVRRRSLMFVDNLNSAVRSIMKKELVSLYLSN